MHYVLLSRIFGCALKIAYCTGTYFTARFRSTFVAMIIVRYLCKTHVRHTSHNRAVNMNIVRVHYTREMRKRPPALTHYTILSLTHMQADVN